MELEADKMSGFFENTIIYIKKKNTFELILVEKLMKVNV